jgi:hypothetical protein
MKNDNCVVPSYTGQKSSIFWDKVCDHYNKHHLIACTKRLARSLKTKWGTIKYNVLKFVGNYGIEFKHCAIIKLMKMTLYKKF